MVNKKEIEQEKPKHSLDELSNKNTEYIFQLKKFLTNDYHYSDDQADQFVNQILDDIVEYQRKGVPANRLYGSPHKLALSHVKGESEKPATSYWLLWLDNSLIFALLLCGMTCLMLFFPSKNKATANSNGILTIILMAVEFGAPWAYFTRWTITPKSQRPKISMLIGVIVLGFLGLFLVVGLAAVIPPQINPSFNAITYLIITIALYGAHYYLKHKYNIKGTLF